MCVGLVLVESDQNLISLCRVLVWFTTTETLICPGWEISVVPVSQPGMPGRPFVPGLATGTKEDLLSRLVTPTGTKEDLLSRLVTPTGTKGAASAKWLAHPFVPVGVTNRDKR